MRERVAWIAVAALVGLPCLGLGFFGDDLYALAVLEGRVGDAGWADVYRAADAAGQMGPIQGDHLPWWSERHPDARWARPLTAAALSLEHAVFRVDATGYHLVSLALFAVVLWLANLGFETHGAPTIARLATLLFALDEAHTLVIAQPAAEHALLGGALGLLAWRLHRTGRRWVALAALGLALGASETAAPLAAWFVAGAITLDEGPWRSRLARAAPAALLCTGFGVAHTAAGFGSLGFADAPHLARAATVHLPVLAASLFAPVAPERLSEAAGGELLAVGAVLLLAVLAALARPVLREHRDARFAALALALHLPWLCLGEPTSVSLLLPSALSAWLLARVAAAYARPDPRGLVTVALIIAHALVAPALHLRHVGQLLDRVALEERAAASIPRVPDARVLLLTSPEGVDADLPLRVMLDPHRPAAIWLLSLSLESHGLWYSDEGLIELSGELLVRQRERRWLLAGPPTVGATRRRGALEVTVREATATHVGKIAIALDVGPDRVWLLAREGPVYRAVALPEEGGAVTLPRAQVR